MLVCKCLRPYNIPRLVQFHSHQHLKRKEQQQVEVCGRQPWHVPPLAAAAISMYIWTWIWIWIWILIYTSIYVYIDIDIYVSMYLYLYLSS